MELNGLTGKPSHIHDPKTAIFDAYRTLFRLWSLAFDIGAVKRRRGARPLSLREARQLLRDAS